MADTDMTAPRRRPRNRKAQISTVAAQAFSERGYHAVGVEDIAAAVGISGPALYRHFPNKYALFADAVFRLADSLMTSTDLRSTGEDGPQARLDAVLTAIVRTTIDNRRTGGLYRWEGRYLVGEDREALAATLRTLHERVASPLRSLRPELAEDETALLATGAISVIASITAHRTALSVRQIEELMTAAAWSVLRTELPRAAGPTDPVVQASDADSKRELLLQRSIVLFYRRGYHEVSLEDIGAAAGMNASSVYRYFPSKAELLATAFHRVNERLTSAVAAALAESQSPVDAVRTLAGLYTELTFAQGDLVAVYFAEIGNLPADQRTELRKAQRNNVEEWAQLVADARPDLSAVASRFLVHAALGLVFDVGRTVRFDRSAPTMARVRHTMATVLLG